MAARKRRLWLKRRLRGTGQRTPRSWISQRILVWAWLISITITRDYRPDKTASVPKYATHLLMMRFCSSMESEYSAWLQLR